MLTLTDEQINVIRNGYKRVQVTVSFPFDNIPDITNEQIVYESLSFNESVCSSDVFRFGNAEASTVSFETVGVGNILGKVIDVKLTYEYILPEDPTNVRTFDLPYGRFTVTSCPRNHENMAHRQVQATSRTSDTNDEIMPQVEQDKLNQMYTSNADYEPNLWYLMDSVYGLSHEYTSTTTDREGSYTTTTNTVSYYFAVHSDTVPIYYVLEVEATIKEPYINDGLYDVIGTFDSTYDDIITEILTTYAEEIVVSDSNKKEEKLARELGYLQIFDRQTDAYVEKRAVYPKVTRMEHIYPYINVAMRSGFRFPYTLKAKLYRRVNTTNTLIKDYGTLIPYPAITFTRYTITNYPMNLTLSINHTLETTHYLYGDIYSFANAYTMSDILTGWAELNAGFRRTDRDGTTSLVQLDKSSAYPLTASDVEGSAWWDEYDIADIGSIKYCWTDGKGDHEGEYVWNPDGSVYDMTDNGLFKNIKLRIKTVNAVSKMTDPTMYYVYSGNWYAHNGTEFVQMGAYESKSSIIEYMLDTFFLPYADIHFTPIDMDIRGLPFLQCGDAITFTAADGTVINSYILNHTFSGIQHITENIDTVQGEVLS